MLGANENAQIVERRRFRAKADSSSAATDAAPQPWYDGEALLQYVAQRLRAAEQRASGAASGRARALALLRETEAAAGTLEAMAPELLGRIPVAAGG